MSAEALRIRCVLLLRFSALFLAIVLPILEVAPWIAAFVYVATKSEFNLFIFHDIIVCIAIVDTLVEHSPREQSVVGSNPT